MRGILLLSFWPWPSSADELHEFLFGQHVDAEFFGLIELAAGLFAGDDEVGLFRNAAGRFAATVVDQLLDLVPREFLQSAGDDDRFTGQRARRLPGDRRAKIKSHGTKLGND